MDVLLMTGVFNLKAIGNSLLRILFSTTNIFGIIVTLLFYIGLWKMFEKSGLKLFLFVLAFAALSTITLEFIDKDKR